MVRPKICRRIFFNPHATHFKPAGISLANLKENILTLPEFEAIRLVDFSEIKQDKAAKKMKVSQPTLSRLLTSARKKIADSLINAKSIKIQGGNFKMVQPRGRGMGFGGRGIGRAAGSRGRMGGTAEGPGGTCICPKCKTTATHKIGIPCTQQKCPKCGTKMTRG